MNIPLCLPLWAHGLVYVGWIPSHGTAGSKDTCIQHSGHIPKLSAWKVSSRGMTALHGLVSCSWHIWQGWKMQGIELWAAQSRGLRWAKGSSNEGPLVSSQLSAICRAFWRLRERGPWWHVPLLWGEASSLEVVHWIHTTTTPPDPMGWLQTA